jgi:hypothetical protein
MNIIAIVATLCLLCTSELSTQKKRSDRDLAGLVGPVRAVREYRTFSQQRLGPAEVSRLLEGRPYKTATYNRGGDLLEEAASYGLRCTYRYSAEGLRVKTAHGDVSPGSGTPLGPYVAQRNADKYDISGNKIATVAYLGGDEAIPWFRQSYEYDGRGRVRTLSHDWRDSANDLRLSHVITYTYDVKGDEKEVAWRNAAGELIDRLTYSNYKHDRRGNWTERMEARFQVYDSGQPKEQWGTLYRLVIYF